MKNALWLFLSTSLLFSSERAQEEAPSAIVQCLFCSALYSSHEELAMHTARSNCASLHYEQHTLIDKQDLLFMSPAIKASSYKQDLRRKVCPIDACGYTCTASRDMIRHTISQHGPQDSFACIPCALVFSDQSFLKRHHLSRHISNKSRRKRAKRKSLVSKDIKV